MATFLKVTPRGSETSQLVNFDFVATIIPDVETTK